MNKKVSKRFALLVLLLTVLLAAVLLIAVWKNGTKPAPTEPSATHNAQMSGESYERWLAAHDYLLTYVAYEQTAEPEIYLTGETDLANKSQSAGIYLLLTVGNQTVLLESKPLSAERTAPGTRDVSAPKIGYATFDEVPLDSVDLSAMEKVDYEQIKALVDAALLPTLNER